MVVAALRFELHIPDSQSLKEKRSVLRPIVEGLRRIASLSVSEVDRHDSWQRASIGVAMVTPDPSSMDALIERARRYVSDRMDVEVIECVVTFLETDR